MGADGPDYSLDLNAAVAVVDASPPIAPGGQPGPSGVPAGARLEVDDEISRADFRQGQRVVWAVLGESETKHSPGLHATTAARALPAAPWRVPAMPPTPGAQGSMRHPVGSRSKRKK